eukprot:338719_1
MSAVTADEWSLTYNLTTVGFGDELRVDPSMMQGLLNAAMIDYEMRIRHCPGDNNTRGHPGKDNMELYAYVRDLAQMSDIAVVLENLGKREMAINMTKKVYECMQPVLSRPKEAPH